MIEGSASLPTKDISHALARIAEQAERAGKVIKSVHDFVRRRESKPENIAPKALLEAVMPLVLLQARKHNVQVEVDASANMPSVRVDRTMVEQVLLNLARNGIQAMETTAHAMRVLRIQVRPVDESSSWLVFSIADHGQGITDETAKQLFTPFFSTKPEGMGLGLSLCRTVIEQHGGLLQFMTNSPVGTVFQFTLPVASTESLSLAFVAH
jgi:two-component system sensor histidine kinase DctS